ncbi:MAG: hypothetical protein N2423_08515 [Novosphingobium sp.]|nr:hypothetical protein [Novosphingobium sp.]
MNYSARSPGAAQPSADPDERGVAGRTGQACIARLRSAMGMCHGRNRTQASKALPARFDLEDERKRER